MASFGSKSNAPSLLRILQSDNGAMNHRQGSAGPLPVVDRMELFQPEVGAFAFGWRATKILEVHSSTVSRL
jgi:hypothetical protein